MSISFENKISPRLTCVPLQFSQDSREEYHGEEEDDDDDSFIMQARQRELKEDQEEEVSVFWGAVSMSARLFVFCAFCFSFVVSLSLSRRISYNCPATAVARDTEGIVRDELLK